MIELKVKSQSFTGLSDCTVRLSPHSRSVSPAAADGSPTSTRASLVLKYFAPLHSTGKWLVVGHRWRRGQALAQLFLTLLVSRFAMLRWRHRRIRTSRNRG